MPNDVLINKNDLLDLDFDTIHWNPAWKGGWWEYYKTIDHLHVKAHAKIKITFGDGYSDDFMVWIDCDHQAIALNHIRTMQQLRDFYKLVNGKELS